MWCFTDQMLSILKLLQKRNVILFYYIFVCNFICLRESVNMYIFGCLICNYYNYKNSKPLQASLLLFQWKHPSLYNLILQLLFIFLWTHWASFLFNSAGVGGGDSLKRKEVWLRPAESLAKGPGIVPVAPATPKQLSDVACSRRLLLLLLRRCLPACLRSRVSIGWAVDYLLAKPNLILTLALTSVGKHTPPPLPPPPFDIHCCIILCNKGCRRQSLWGQCLGGMSCTGRV